MQRIMWCHHGDFTSVDVVAIPNIELLCVFQWNIRGAAKRLARLAGQQVA